MHTLSSFIHRHHHTVRFFSPLLISMYLFIYFTSTYRHLSGPGAVILAHPVFGTPGKEVAGLAAVHQRVAKARQVHAHHVHVECAFGLLACVGCGRMTKPTLDKKKKRKNNNHNHTGFLNMQRGIEWDSYVYTRVASRSISGPAGKFWRRSPG